EGHEVLVFEVDVAPTPVMVIGDGYPYRIADQVVRFEADKIAAWKEKGLVETWEGRRSERTLPDLDRSLISRALAQSALAPGTSTSDYLLYRRLSDFVGSRYILRRAAELLFARAPHSVDHPNAGVRLFRVIGTERKVGAQHN